MTLNIFSCKDGCCKIHIKNYKFTPRYYDRKPYKAGVFIYDPIQDRVLLVQSRGHLFGPPKGTLKEGEEILDCAVREVKEETGIEINSKDLIDFITIKNRSTYYYLEMDTCDIKVQNNGNELSNDANGITWIKIKCLEKMIKEGNIVLNHYAKIVIRQFIGIIFPNSEWTKITRKVTCMGFKGTELK
jgi:8-oxo-dGTP pyrophosphatase MutT (NUDIX family)